MRGLLRSNYYSVFKSSSKRQAFSSLSEADKEQQFPFDAPYFSKQDVISYSANTTAKPGKFPYNGYRVLKKRPSMLSEAALRYPDKFQQLIPDKEDLDCPLMINAYPAHIPPPSNVALVDTHLLVETASRALRLAAYRKRAAIILAQPLFMMEILLHHRKHSLEFPDNLVLFFGGYCPPTSLYRAIKKFFSDMEINVSYIVGYGVAEIDAGMFYAAEQIEENEEWLYYIRSDVVCELVDCDDEGFGKMLLSVGNMPLTDTGDIAKKVGDAYFIRSNPKKISPSVLELLNSWSEEDWERKTGNLSQSNGQLYFQLRKGQKAITDNELSFFRYAEQFDFCWQKKPQWNYSFVDSSKTNLDTVFFNQFHCLHPDSPFVKNYRYPTTKGILLAEEIVNLPAACKMKGGRFYAELRDLVSKALANSLGNEGVSNEIISSKLVSDSLTILRNSNGKVVGILTFSCSSSPEDFMYMGIHLLDEARSRDIMKIHHAMTVERAMVIRKTDSACRLSKTHTPIAIFVEQKTGRVEPDINAIQPKLENYICSYIDSKLKVITQKYENNYDISNDLKVLNTLLHDGFISLEQESELKNNLLVFSAENSKQWQTSLHHLRFNLSKLINFGDEKYSELIEFKKIDGDLRSLFSQEIKHIKPRIIARLRALLADQVDDKSCFDSDYLIHRKADPPYNLSEIHDCPIKSINQFLRGMLRYEEGDIFVYTTSVTRDELTDLKKEILEKLPPDSKPCFNRLVMLWQQEQMQSSPINSSANNPMGLFNVNICEDTKNDIDFDLNLNSKALYQL